jgi:hypothetical protein
MKLVLRWLCALVVVAHAATFANAGVFKPRGKNPPAKQQAKPPAAAAQKPAGTPRATPSPAPRRSVAKPPAKKPPSRVAGSARPDDLTPARARKGKKGKGEDVVVVEEEDDVIIRDDD